MIPYKLFISHFMYFIVYVCIKKFKDWAEVPEINLLSNGLIKVYSIAADYKSCELSIPVESQLDNSIKYRINVNIT